MVVGGAAAALFVRQRRVWQPVYQCAWPTGFELHVLGVVLAWLCTYLQANMLRQTFLFKMLQVSGSERRIEQLAMDKQRLDYERACAQSQVTSSRSAVSAGDGRSLAQHIVA